jgi:Ser/Thr protein kinase RdoA (MazF antagonist)
MGQTRRIRQTTRRHHHHRSQEALDRPQRLGYRAQPTLDDAEATNALVDELRSAADAAVVDRALQIVWATMSEFARQPGMAGLIHADLHVENVLFHRGVARAIDFDDCGWGPLPL